MTFQYTKATLKSHLQTWVEGNGGDASPTFIADLDEIIQRGELRLARDLDLDNLDSMQQATTAGTVPEVFKPSTLINERLLSVSISGRKTQLLKRSRAFVDAMNITLAQGQPKYFAELDEDRWTLAPVPSAAWLIDIHGNYRPGSLVDGSDGNTTWFSTRVPDMLAHACAIEAARRLKMWSLMGNEEKIYLGKLDNVRAITDNLQRSDVEDLVGGLTRMNQPTTPPEPEATT